MDNVNYWDNFYKNEHNTFPSQFAAFIASEYSDKSHLLDFGCGLGKDTFFFSNYYDTVIGLDSSLEAITKNKTRIGKSNKNVHFLLNDLSQKESLKSELTKYLPVIENCIFYARFFLHAIDEATENNFLDIVKDLMTNNNILAIEFRTLKDKFLKKEFDNHHRRFINPRDLSHKLSNINLSVSYYVEGQGYAKYKADDAYVARMIIS